MIPSLAAAQVASISASDPESVVAAIRAFGHKAKLSTDSEGQPQVDVEREGINYTVYFYSCENESGCLDLQFYSGFNVDQPMTAEWANDWNLQWIVGRAEVTQEGDPAISYFVTTQGGLSSESFEGVMQVWDMSLTQFIQDIGW
jgi:hypothetical protein